MKARTAAVVIAALAVAGLALLLAGPGSGARRPEGAVERFLHALSTDSEDGIERWGARGVAERLVDFEPDDDTRFATIEVGRAATRGDTAEVPARVVRNDDADTAVELAVVAERAPGSGEWRVVGARPVSRAAVPSHGAPRPARAPLTLWLVLAPVALGVALGADALVSRLRRAGVMEPGVTPIGAAELAARLAAGDLVLLDAQAPGWYEREHLPGALPVDWDDIAGSAATHIPALDTEVVVYCWNATCLGSEVVAGELAALGYRNVRRYVGGKQEWIDQGRPVEGDGVIAERPSR